MRHDVFHCVGTLPAWRLLLKMFCSGTASSTAQVFNSLAHTPSGPAALGFSLPSTPLTCCAVMVSGDCWQCACEGGVLSFDCAPQVVEVSSPEKGGGGGPCAAFRLSIREGRWMQSKGERVEVDEPAKVLSGGGWPAAGLQSDTGGRVDLVMLTTGAGEGGWLVF